MRLYCANNEELLFGSTVVWESLEMMGIEDIVLIVMTDSKVFQVILSKIGRCKVYEGGYCDYIALIMRNCYSALWLNLYDWTSFEKIYIIYKNRQLEWSYV